MRCPFIVLVLMALVACSTTDKPDPPTITVDPAVRPSVSDLPGFTENEARPIASLVDDEGNQVEFIENELWLSTDSEEQLTTFINRWQGEILQTIDSTTYGLNLAKQYLVRVNVSSADLSSLAANLQELDENASGNINVSSENAQKLLAVNAQEAVDGLKIGVNWVAAGIQFRNQESFEAPTGPDLDGISYDPNAFAWPSHSVESPLDIGVAEAWRVLDLADRFSNKVKLAILDMGFDIDPDTPDNFVAISNVPLIEPLNTENLLSCGSSDCPWHGTNVLNAAMAVPNNNYGSAGPAGPVAEPVIVYTSYDFFTSIAALGEARVAGAKIANMSYGAPVPDVLFFTVLPFEAATLAFRETGMLLFAAAGNDGKNVDAERCFIVCWEKTWHTPCENAGVICVGGTKGNSDGKASGSNYGKEQVDIFAPYTLWLGPDPENPNNQTQRKNGTSFSSPFAAGVAALIWAANPSLSADEVETILLDTAHKSSDDQVGQYVNALNAVTKALGNVPPGISVFGREDGESFEFGLNLPINLSATVEDFEEGKNCCNLTWTSDVDGLLGSGASIDVTFLTEGERVVTVSAEDSEGASTSFTLNITIVNTAPTVEIVKPLSTDEIFRGTAILLEGSSFDINEPDQRLACGSLVWTSSNATDALATQGCQLELSFNSNGERTLTLTGADPQGLSATDTVTITVVDPPVNLPPVVRITSPEGGDDISVNELLNLSGTAIDPEGNTPLTFEWTAQLDNGAAIVLGTEPGLTWTPSDSFDFSSEGRYDLLIQFTATDSLGNTGSDFVTFEIIIIN